MSDWRVIRNKIRLALFIGLPFLLVGLAMPDFGPLLAILFGFAVVMEFKDEGAA